MGFLSYVEQNQQIASGDYSPEKAGVGGSTPSLAAIFSMSEVGNRNVGWFGFLVGTRNSLERVEYNPRYSSAGDARRMHSTTRSTKSINFVDSLPS